MSITIAWGGARATLTESGIWHSSDDVVRRLLNHHFGRQVFEPTPSLPFSCQRQVDAALKAGGKLVSEDLELTATSETLVY